MKRVAVFTPLTHWDPGYSLCTVIRQQIAGLQRYGHDVILVGLPSLKDAGGLDVPIRHVPQLILEPYLNDQAPASFEEDARRVAIVLESVVRDRDVVLCHDIHFQEWFVPYNKAVRLVSERLPRLRWLHFTHSAPSPWRDAPYPHSLRYEMMPNGKVVYLNHTDHVRCVEMLKGAELSDVVVVPNPMDSEHLFGMSASDADVVVVYPFSATRMAAKGVAKVIRLLGAMKKLGRSVHFTAMPAHANAEAERQAIAEMRIYARAQGITDHDMTWTSDEHPHGVPRERVRDAFLQSNLFLLPSESENCSLTLLEAALAKNLCVLNRSFRPMADQLGVEAMYFDFGALGTPVHYDDEDRWYREVALLVLYELEHTKALQGARVVRQNHSIKTMMEKHLLPLIEQVCTP